MVRLKGHCVEVSFYSYRISIPYGAIKSSLRSATVTLREQISIPYGAIKSQERQHVKYIRTIFQFLMVRLKGPCKIARDGVFNHFNSLWCD